MSVPSWALPYLETINGSGFFWKDCDSFNLVDHSPYMVEWDAINHSYYTSASVLMSDYQTNNIFPIEDILDINIISSNNTFSFSYTSTRTSIYMVWGTGTNYGYSDNVRFSYNTGNQNYYIQTMVLPSHNKITATLTDSQTYDTVEQILNYLSYHYRNVNIYVDGELWSRGGSTPTYTSNGGGATHIAKVTGQLKDLSSNLSDILLVSGGGGGGLLVGETDYSGKEAGGISGSGDNSADQTVGNAFGQGESGTNVSGGGSGLYGGYKGTSSKSGGAGSGYVGNSLVSNKKMVGYNVPTSSAEGTKTESVNVYSATNEANKPKAGNGFARIKFLRACWGGEEVPILWAGNSNKMTVQISNSSILFKLYTSDSVIYSFTAHVGSTIYDADNIYVGFLIDTNLELAKPSMVYVNGSVLSYNQEEPTEAQMGDIYTWISPGLPSE